MKNVFRITPARKGYIMGLYFELANRANHAGLTVYRVCLPIRDGVRHTNTIIFIAFPILSTVVGSVAVDCTHVLPTCCTCGGAGCLDRGQYKSAGW